MTLSVAADAYLEYLPEPRILFPDAALEQTSRSTAPRAASPLYPTPSRSTIRQAAAEASDGSQLDDPAMRQQARACRAVGYRRSRYRIGGRVHGLRFSYPRAPGRLRDCTALADDLTKTFSSTETLYGAASLLPADGGVGGQTRRSGTQGRPCWSRGSLASARVAPFTERPLRLVARRNGCALFSAAAVPPNSSSVLSFNGVQQA